MHATPTAPASFLGKPLIDIKRLPERQLQPSPVFWAEALMIAELATQCPVCGRANRAGRRYCAECGRRLAVACGICGAEQEPTEKLCRQCGATLQPAPAVSHQPRRAESPPAGALPEGERRQLTVMFCDLVGSTELAGHLDPEDLRATLERYQRATADVVGRLDGYVAKFLGDGILIYFGWPRAHDDDPARAVRAGLALVEAIGTLSAGSDDTRLAARIAVHTGAVVVGPDGEIFGNAPNLAARAQGVAAPETVVVTSATQRLIAGRFETEEMGSHPLKGVSEPIALHRILRPRPARGRLRATGARGLTPFVGREHEQLVLRGVWEDVCRGQGRVVVVIGEPGIGKSRLVDQFATGVASTPHTWLESGGSPYHQHTPFFPVADVLRQALGWRGDEPTEQRIRSLDRSLASCGVNPSEAVPLVAPVLDLTVAEGLYPPLTSLPERRRRQLLSTLVAWVLGAARARPLVVVLEDLHWADPSTIELQTLLVQQGASVPLLLLYTTRTELQPPWRTLGHHAHIVLNRLERDEAVQLVGKLGVLPENVIEAIVTRTDGVPLFVEELTKTVLEREPTTALAEIPASLQDSLMARLDRLGPEKHVAQLASVIGRAFSRAVLEPLASERGANLDAALQRLIEADIVREGGSTHDAFVFKHVLVQEAAYASLLRSRRREIHGQVARMLATMPDRAEAAPEALARHYAGAGEVQLAIDHYRTAGEQAMRHCAHAEAIQHFSSAIALVPGLTDSHRRAEAELALQIALGAPLVASRGYGSADVERSHRRAYELCGDVGGGPALHQALSGLYLFHQAHAQLGPAAERAAELLELGEREQNDFVIQWGCFFSSQSCYYRGAYRAALGYLERGLALYDPHAAVPRDYVAEHDPGLALLCYAAMTGWSVGAGDRALGWIERAVELGTGSGHPFKLAFVQSFAALVHFLRDDPSRVLEYATTAIRICTEQEFPVYLGLALMLEGWATARRGETQRGLDMLQRGLGQAATTGTRTEAPRALGLVADVQLLCGHPTEALDAITAGLAIADRKGSHYWDAELLRLRGEAILQLDPGAEGEAIEDFRRARTTACSQEARAFELRAALSEAKCLRQGGDRRAAEGLVAPIYAGFTEGLDLPDLCAARALLTAAR